MNPAQIVKSQRIEREIPLRCKRMMREMLTCVCCVVFICCFSPLPRNSLRCFAHERFWRKNEKEERETKKKAEKEEGEKKKRDEVEREVRRQQKKFNFLLAQTELCVLFSGVSALVPAVSPTTVTPRQIRPLYAG
jgi:flagellar biosynthesis component FlhA